jgi:hypothetical protein
VLVLLGSAEGVISVTVVVVSVSIISSVVMVFVSVHVRIAMLWCDGIQQMKRNLTCGLCVG